MANKTVKKNKKMKLPKTVQESIPYTHIFDTDGIIETKPGVFSQAYKLEDVNFKTAPDSEQENMFLRFGELLNTFGPDSRFQISIFNHYADKQTTIKDICLDPQKDNLNPMRQEWNNILMHQMSKGKNNLTQEKYLAITTADDSAEEACKKLDSMSIEIKKSINRITKSKSIETASITERLETLHSIYNQDDEGMFENSYNEEEDRFVFDINQLYKAGLTSKDVVGPSGFEFKHNYFKMGNTYGRALYLEGIPTWLSTDFISDVADIECNMLVSVNYEPIDQADAMKMVRNQMISIDGQVGKMQGKAAEEGYSASIPPELERAQKRARELMEDLIGRDQKLYYVCFTVVVFGNTKEELKTNSDAVVRVGRRHLAPIKTLYFQQEQGLNTALPLATNYLHTKRMYTTDSASVFIPYTSQELHQKSGFYYGINPDTKKMILYSRKLGKNHNGLIFGESGSGKSFAAKCEMLMALLKSDHNQVYVIDPDSEYSKMAKALDGEIIALSPGAKVYINPLDMDIDYAGDGDPVALKSDFVVSMVEIMLGNGQTLSSEAKSMLDRCVKNIYRPYLEHMMVVRKENPKITCDKEASPTLNNLYQELLRQKDLLATQLAKTIEMYTTGSYSTFAFRTNVETNARFVVYDIKGLGTGMKDLGLHICTNDIWNKMIENRVKNYWTWFYIDEFYLLLRSESTAQFLMEVWKRCRKWNGVPTGIMQNTEDLLRSATTRNIFNNSSFVMMLSLPQIDRTNLSTLLQISDAQLDYITNSDKGCGLLYNGKVIIPFANEFPKDSPLYEIMSTTDETALAG